MDIVTIVGLALAPSVTVLLLGCTVAAYRTIREAAPRRRRLLEPSSPQATEGRGAR